MAAVDHAHEDFKEMELWEHLQELRTRLIRSVAYLGLGLVVGWILYPQIYALIHAPIQDVMNERQWQEAFRSFQQPFLLRLQVSFFSGLAIAIPFVTMEVWGFVAPGLTRNERKACYLVFPLSVVFFLLGLAAGFSIMGPSVRWFSGFAPQNVPVLQEPGMYITFMVKMVVAFGICFQLPILLMFLAFVGLVTSRGLREQWRLWVVGCFVLGAMATPGGDPYSMVILALPLAVLYVASIGLVAAVERFREKRDALPA